MNGHREETHKTWAVRRQASDLGSNVTTLPKQLPRLVESHLTNSMSAEEVNMVMRNRFQKLSLPSLHSVSIARPDSHQQSEMGAHLASLL